MNIHTGPFKAFHGDAALQAMMLAEVELHIEADSVRQGFYNKNEGGEFQGCFIGCTTHALKGDEAETYSSSDGVFEAYGFPAPLTKICEAIFEGLPSELAAKFFSDVPNVLNLGADLSLVHWQFLDWMLADTFEKYDDDEVRTDCAGALEVISKLANGQHITATHAEAARAAAEAARAAAATHAARAARAAAATHAAHAVVYAAHADAAEAARYQEFATKLVEILGCAK